MDQVQAPEDIDIFISYSHTDNAPIRSDRPGWVTDLHSNLDLRLKQIGSKCVIFRDPKLSGVGKTLKKSIEDKIEKSSYLLAIVSPPYVDSDYCRLERDYFLELLGKEQGIEKIIVVEKLPVKPPPPMPEELGDKKGYRFYEVDKENEVPIEVTQWSDKAGRGFLKLINNLAYDIREELAKEMMVDKSKENTIYLAETTDRLNQLREEIANELKQRDYNVIPNRKIGIDRATVTNNVMDNLNRSFLSVHIIGDDYVPLNQDTDESIEDLQLGVAVGQESLKTVVWQVNSSGQSEKDGEPNDSKQRLFLDRIGKEEAIADTIEGSIEVFKSVLRQMLEKPQTVTNLNTELKGLDVYIYHNMEDEAVKGEAYNHIRMIREYLLKNGYGILRPDYEVAEAQIEEEHQSNIEKCHAIIYYCGKANERWNKEKTKALPNEKKWRRENCFIYVEENAEYWEQQCATIELAGASFNPKILTSFLDGLSQSK